MASSADLNIYSAKFTLNNNIQMPAVGLGTYRVRNADNVMTMVDWALEAGYRLFDTAAVYGNECHLRTAFKTLLPRYGLEREDIFITSKISPSDHGDKEAVDSAYMKSLNNLGLDYLDLYLIHFPRTAKFSSDDPNNSVLREFTWAAMVELYDEGRVNAIGVSNFTIKHLQKLLKKNHGVIPAVNQIEWHPYYHQIELQQYCKRNDIVLQAYSPLGGASAANMSVIQDPVVIRIAKKLNVSCAQLLLAWALQQDVAVIPKSTNKNHMKENIELNFTIPDEDMKALSALGEYNRKFAWDPSLVI